MTNYVITGHTVAGKRFTITTTTPQHYNIWSGTLWKLIGGYTPSGRPRRKLIKHYF